MLPQTQCYILHLLIEQLVSAHPPAGWQYIPCVLFKPQYHRPTLPFPAFPAHPSSSPEHGLAAVALGHHSMRRKLHMSCSNAEPKELLLTCAKQCPGEFTQCNHLSNTSNLQFQQPQLCVQVQFGCCTNYFLKLQMALPHPALQSDLKLKVFQQQWKVPSKDKTHAGKSFQIYTKYTAQQNSKGIKKILEHSTFNTESQNKSERSNTSHSVFPLELCFPRKTTLCTLSLHYPQQNYFFASLLLCQLMKLVTDFTSKILLMQ